MSQLYSYFIRRPFSVFASLSLLICFLYAQTVYDLYDLWIVSGNTTYSHGSLLLAAALYLLVDSCRNIEISIRPSAMGVTGLLVLSLTWAMAEMVNVRVASQLTFVLMFPTLAWGLFGWETFKRMAFPLLLPICAVPIWDAINEEWFQVATAQTVKMLLGIIGVPVSQEGVLLLIPAGTFRVAENCSGMRQLVVAIPLFLIFAYLQQLRLAVMLSFGLLGAFVAFAVNSIRISIVVLSGHLTEMQHYFVTEDHVTLGWVLFAIAIAGSAFAASRFRWAIVMMRPSVVDHRNEETIVGGRRVVFSCTAVLIAIVIAPVLLYLYAGPNLPERSAVTIEVQAPSSIGAWRRLDTDELYTPITAQPVLIL